MVGVYKFHDMMLQSLLQIAGDDTAVVLISDHGYYSDHLRPDPHDEHLSPAAWHRPFGVFAAQAPQMPGAYELLTKLYRNLGMTQEAVDTAMGKANAQIPKAANDHS